MNMDNKEEHSYSVNSSCLTGNGDIKWKEFDQVVQTFMKEQGVPGASVAVSKNQEIIYTQGYGSAGASKRVHPDSVFRIASISKPITAFAVFHLCLDFGVSLESKVFGKKGILKTYKFKDKRVSAITIRHLLQHSAGWDRDIAGDLAFVRPAAVVRCDPESMEHNHALLSCTLKKRLQFKPGSRHAYSNLGYLVLGLVIEDISGMSFDAYLSKVLTDWNIPGIDVGGPWRADWTGMEVEYYNNREPGLVQSLHREYGELLPQYGGLAMHSAAAYGGLISNAVSLLQFMNIIENLACKETEDQINDNKGDNLNNERHALGNLGEMSGLVKESLQRPDYESGLDWYGLGWDVQDKGRSWGHTGGMEGTSCVLFRHVSGVSWVLLMNAWAKDIDLNGVMKCAVSRVPGLILFDCDMRFVREYDEEEVGLIGKAGAIENGRILFTNDKSQAIVLGVDEIKAYGIASSLKAKFYVPTWVNVLKTDLNFSAIPSSLNKSQFPKTSGFESDCYFGGYQKLKYIFIFSLLRQQYEDCILLLNKNSDDILALSREKQSLGYTVQFVDSFCDYEGNIRFSAVLIKFDCEANVCKRSLHLAVKANKYIRDIKSWVKSNVILCQSVTEVRGELFVTVLLENKTDIASGNNDGPSYWVQIEPESFLTELNKKIKQTMNLTYAKFFNADSQSWVSGCWASGQAINIYHRISMSKYGLFPELAEAAAENIQLLSVSEYEDEGVVYYAGLWMAQ